MAQYGSLTKSQMDLLTPHAGVFDWDDLPKDHETTWSDAQRYLGDIYNPHFVDAAFRLIK